MQIFVRRPGGGIFYSFITILVSNRWYEVAKQNFDKINPLRFGATTGATVHMYTRIGRYE